MNPRLAYLVSQYPTVSHSFILREIRALRGLGFDILTISVNPADRPPDQMSADERDEWSRTRVITTTGWFTVAGIHARVLLSNPAGYLRGLLSAFRLAGSNLRGMLMHLLYFGEAVVAGHWIASAGCAGFHSHFTSTVALFVKRVFNLRLSMTIHGSDEFIDPAGFHMAEKVSSAALICVISSFGRSQVMRFSDPADWSKIRVIPLGVDTSLYSPKPFRERPDVFEITSVGRLVPVKGYPVLLEAVEQLVKSGRRLRLRLGGDGPSRAGLEHEIERRGLREHVRLEGTMNAQAVRELYRESDIFALASFAEGVPVVLMEAMATEVPCVATRITGVPELIRDGIDGLLVTPSSASELADAIGRLMDDPDLRRRLGQAGRLHVIEEYNLERNIAALAATLRDQFTSGC